MNCSDKLFMQFPQVSELNFKRLLLIIGALLFFQSAPTLPDLQISAGCEYRHTEASQPLTPISKKSEVPQVVVQEHQSDLQIKTDKEPHPGKIQQITFYQSIHFYSLHITIIRGNSPPSIA